MTGSTEYLERVCADGFKRELEQDENVVRTLPIFVAILALTVNLLGYIGTRFPPLDGSPFGWTMLGFLAAATALLVGVFWWLFVAIRPRVYRLPPRETELVAWVAELRAYHSGVGLGGAALEDSVASDLRERMTMEYAEAAEHNRHNNRRKAAARTQGMTLLIGALIIAFSMVATIFIHGRLTLA